MLGQEQLSRTLLPVGELTKDDVRRRPERSGCEPRPSPTARTCASSRAAGRGFVGTRVPMHPAACRRHVRPPSGHRAGRRAGDGRPAQGRRTAGRRAGAPCRRRGCHGGSRQGFRRRASSTPSAPGVDLGRWLGRGRGDGADQRHGVPRPATVEARDDGTVTVRWHQPQRRVAPGQSIALYDVTDTFVLGGASRWRSDRRAARCARPSRADGAVRLPSRRRPAGWAGRGTPRCAPWSIHPAAAPAARRFRGPQDHFDGGAE